MDPAFLIGALVGGLLIGALCGLVPFFLARKQGRMTLGLIALVVCTFCGVILGILLAGPVAAVFSIVIVTTNNSQSGGSADSSSTAGPSDRGTE